MIFSGMIKNYDRIIGKGRITPEDGGDELTFRMNDLENQAIVPRANQRYGYEIKKANNGKSYAVNVHPQVKKAFTRVKSSRMTVEATAQKVLSDQP